MSGVLDSRVHNMGYVHLELMILLMVMLRILC